MSFNFKKLLPSGIRDTIYGDIITVTKSIIDDINSEKTDRIKYRNNIDTINDDEIKDLAEKFGFALTTLDGYTSTSEYLKREIETVVKRITNKTTINAYKYIFYIFNLLGNVYLLFLEENDELTPWLNWLTYEETEEQILYLDADEDIVYYYTVTSTGTFDSGSTFDSGGTFDSSTLTPYPDPPIVTGEPLLYLDQDVPDDWTLDFGDIAGSLTRHFLLSYDFIFVENETEFMSNETLLALYNDIVQAKRKVEIPHFEAKISLTVNNDNTENITTYTNEQETLTATKNTILIGSDFSTVTYIKVGTGSIATLDLSITDLATPVQTISLDDMNLVDATATTLAYREKIYQDKTFDYAITEIGFFDVSNNCIMYAKFPIIQFNEKMLSSIYFDAEIV